MQQFREVYNSSIANTKVQLDVQPLTSFSPSLTLLDALIQSIPIQP